MALTFRLGRSEALPSHPVWHATRNADAPAPVTVAEPTPEVPSVEATQPEPRLGTELQVETAAAVASAVVAVQAEPAEATTTPETTEVEDPSSLPSSSPLAPASQRGFFESPIAPPQPIEPESAEAILRPEPQLSAPVPEVPAEPQVSEESPGITDRLEAFLDDSQDAERTYSRSAFVTAMSLTFALGLGIGLAIWLFTGAHREKLPRQPELRRLAMESQGLQQRLERQQAILGEQVRKAEVEDANLRREWTAILGELDSLAGEQDTAMAQAQALSDRLAYFVEQNRELSRRPEVPATIRQQALDLIGEGERYRTVLGHELTRLVTEKERFQGWMANLVEQLERRKVQGIVVRVIYSRQRQADAEKVADLLNEAGAAAHVFATDITEPEVHKGRIYYHGGVEEEAARQIAQMVRPIEELHIESIGVANPFISLWIVGGPLEAEVEGDIISP